ncbi:MAG TPA: membrane dipeptidase [Acidimicrobiia bacterium]|jgi:microsomal dipeptidase-like Zn-dependent dipeptidase|nr:membrane dipeptidase [Acidimicrobiia bacterium]HIL46848.1 membrane dipeptidase [Acidimicrobiia bacterium]
MIIDGLEINNWDRSVVEQVRSGGINIVHATCGVWEDTAGAMTRIADWRHFARQNADLVRIVGSIEEMQTAKADNVLGILLGFQNSSMLGDDPEMAGIFADVGIRVVQLTYNVANHLGSSCWEPEDGGLTRVGQRMVTALNQAGVLIDLSHVGNRTGLEAITASSKPVAVTHGNPFSFCDSPRNKPDDLLKVLAEHHGVIGCTLYPLFLGGADVPRQTWGQMMADLVELIGIDHVAIGSDAVVGWEPNALGWMRNGRWDRPENPDAVPAFPPWPDWFQGPEDFGSLGVGLEDAGFLPAERHAVLGGNWMRIFAEVMA